MSRRLGGLTVTVIVALGLALSACSGDPAEPADPPISSSTVSPTPSPSTTPSGSSTAEPSAPPLPSPATKNSDAGAEAFVRYWVQVLNYAQRTGDADALDAISTRACDGCVGAVTALRSHTTVGAPSRAAVGRVEASAIAGGLYSGDWGGFARPSDARRVINADGADAIQQGRVT